MKMSFVQEFTLQKLYSFVFHIQKYNPPGTTFCMRKEPRLVIFYINTQLAQNLLEKTNKEIKIFTSLLSKPTFAVNEVSIYVFLPEPSILYHLSTFITSNHQCKLLQLQNKSDSPPFLFFFNLVQTIFGSRYFHINLIMGQKFPSKKKLLKF